MSRRRYARSDDLPEDFSALLAGLADQPHRKPTAAERQCMEDLTLMCKNGWGDTPQNKLPEDWRTRVKPVAPAGSPVKAERLPPLTVRAGAAGVGKKKRHWTGGAQ